MTSTKKSRWKDTNKVSMGGGLISLVFKNKADGVTTIDSFFLLWYSVWQFCHE